MEAVPYCMLCGSEGSLLYEGLEDRLYGVPGKFSLYSCPDCGLVWLNPRPVEEDLAKCYMNAYYTHTPPASLERSAVLRGWREFLRRLIWEAYYAYPPAGRFPLLRKAVGKVLGALPPLRRRAAYDLGVLFLPFHGQRRLLDVGCGNGAYLKLMQELGWQVTGIDIDPAAVAVCRAQGLNAFVGTLETMNFPDHAFDAITLSHVFEHLPDPAKFLQECYRILSPGGYIAMKMPNIKSLGHRLFKRFWRGLEPPRHLSLWDRHTLHIILHRNNFKIYTCHTSSHIADFIYEYSVFSNEKYKKSFIFYLRKKIFKIHENFLLLFDKDAGEEVFMVARKSGMNLFAKQG